MRTANINSLASTNALLINTSVGNKGAGVSLRAISCFNAGASAAYLKLYNTNKTPVVGTDTPTLVIAMPAASNGVGFNDNDAIQFNLGLGIAITGLPADTDTTAVAAGQVKASIAYL